MGAIHKKRFFLIIALSFICTSLLGFAMITGAMATDISISSSSMKVVANNIASNKLTLYGAVDETGHSSDNSKPITYIRLVKPRLTNVCVVMRTGHIPVIGEYSLVIHSPVITADYIVLSTSNVHANLILHNLSIGIDPPHANSSVPPGIFSINSQSASLNGAAIDASYISAGSIEVQNARVSIIGGKYSC